MASWRKAREVYGKIRSGQLWRKRDSGMVMRVARKGSGQRWSVIYSSPGHKVSHTVDERIIYHYYDLIK